MDNTIEEFREIITREYSSKGVIPPQPGSEEEKLLYQKWLKGKELLSHE